MRGSAALAARIKRLEAERRRVKRRPPRLTFFIHRDDAAEATVDGFANADGLMVPREPGEALPDVLRRAWRHPDAGTALFAVYPPDDTPEQVPGQSVPEPEPEPDPEPALFTGHWSEWRASQEETPDERP